MGNVGTAAEACFSIGKDLCLTGKMKTDVQIDQIPQQDEENYTVSRNNLVQVSGKARSAGFHHISTSTTCTKEKLYVFTFKTIVKKNDQDEVQLLNLQDQKAQSSDNLSYKLDNLKKFNPPKTEPQIESATKMIYTKLSNSKINGFGMRNIDSNSNDELEKHNTQDFILKREVSQSDFAFLLKCLNSIFPKYQEEEKQDILKHLINYTVFPDTVITKHSDSINCVYIIRSGKIGLYRKLKLTEVFNEGDCFGDFTLLKNDQTEKLYGWSGCEYRSIVKSELFMVSSQEINRVHSEYTKRKYEEIIMILNQIPLLKFLDIQTKKLFAENLVKVVVKEGMKLMLAPNKSDSVLFVEDGVLKQESENEQIQYFKAGDTINYEFLLKPGTQRYTVTVHSQTASVVILSADLLINLMGEDFRSKIMFICFYSSIEANKPLFQILSHFAKHNSEIGSIRQNSENTSAVTNTMFDSKKNHLSIKQGEKCLNSSKLLNSNVSKYNKDSLQSNCSLKMAQFINSKNEDFKFLVRKFSLRFVEAGQPLHLKEDTCVILLYGAIEETITKKLIEPLKVISNITDNKDDEKENEAGVYIFIKPSYILRGELHSILKYEDTENKNTLIHHFLDVSKWMSFLPELTLLSLGSYIERIKYPPKAIIKERGKPLESILLIKHGRLLKRTWSNNSKVAKETLINEGSIVGEKELFFSENSVDEELEVLETQRGSPTVILQIRARFIKIFLSKHLNKYIKDEIYGKANKSVFDLVKADLISFIGFGAYGFVNLIRLNNRLYALKSIKKDQINYQSSVVKYVGFEKENLSLVQSPFILGLEDCLSDAQYFHFVTEFIQGQSLEKIINSKDSKLDIDTCLFYTANLIVMLESLKLKSVVHRDIKPSNIMIQTNGYLKLIDFGVSKRVKDFTYTIVGSPYFIAPEVLEGQGYSYSCDYWSVGITLYKMYFKRYPFGENSNTVMDVYKEICEGALSFPSNNLRKNSRSDQVEKLIKLLLRKSAKRPCSIKELNLYLSFIDWSEIMNLNFEPSFVPEIDSSELWFYNEEDNRFKGEKDFSMENSKGVPFNNKLISKMQESKRKRSDL